MIRRNTSRPGFQDVFLPNFPTIIDKVENVNDKMVFKDSGKSVLDYLREDLKLSPERASHFEGMRFWLPDKDYLLFILKFPLVPADEITT